MKHHAATLNKYSTENEGAQVGGKWGKLFIWFQTSPPCRDRKLRKGMNWLQRGGWALIKWGLVWFVGLSVLKWASILSSARPRASHGYLVMILPVQRSSSLTLPFISKDCSLLPRLLDLT